MEPLLQVFTKETLIALVSSFFALVVFFVVNFIKEIKESNKELLRSINGLGQRLNREISEAREELSETSREFKKDYLRIEEKIDHGLVVMNELEKRIILLDHQVELKMLKSTRTES